MAEFETLLRDALLVTALLTIPILTIATIVGALVAILQAATQIQEQTLTLLPKVIAVGLACARRSGAALDSDTRVFSCC